VKLGPNSGFESLTYLGLNEDQGSCSSEIMIWRKRCLQEFPKYRVMTILQDKKILAPGMTSDCRFIMKHERFDDLEFY